MALDFKSNKTLIGCIPLSAHPTHPTDQTPCVIWDCPTCKEPMWVSELKRGHQAAHPDVVEIDCMRCIAKESIKKGVEVEMVDLAGMN